MKSGNRKSIAAAKEAFSPAALWLKLKQFFTGKRRYKQMYDVLVFASVVYMLYRFGKNIGDAIEEQLPSEANQRMLIEQMQLQAGAHGGPY